MKRPSFISWEQVRVGAVLLVALGIIAIAIVRLGAAASLFSSRYPLTTFLANANGLRVGGSVMIAGKLAGTVREIEFLPVDPDTTRNLRLVIELDEKVRDQVRGDSRARLRTVGLLGDKVIDINPGTLAYPVLAAGDTIPAEPSVDYELVIERASGAIDELVTLTGDLRTITGGLVRGEGTAGQLLTNRALYDQLTGTLERTNQLVARLQNPNGTMGRMLDDPALYQNLVAVTGSLDSLTVRLQSTDGSLGRLMRDDTLYTRMVSVVGQADSLLHLMHDGNGAVSRLLTDQQLYDQMNKTVTDLNSLLEDVRRDPRRYLKGLIKVGF